MLELMKISFANITGDTWIVTFAGFFIVFLVLVLLIVIFSVFGKVMVKINAGTEDKAPQTSVKKSMGSQAVSEETAAVVTAAVAEASGGKNFIVKEIKEAKKS